MSETAYQSETLEHLGLVAGMFDELGIGELVDALIPQDLAQRTLSVGQALKAMVLNGLGFANRRLYLTSHFFQHKPTERLIAPGVKPEHLNDDALGKALDTLYACGATELYRVIAAQAARRLGLQAKVGHLDTTSFHVDGRYNSSAPPEEGAGVIHITKGYSRDHRAELNQVILELITEHQASLPLLMRPLSGNTSDKAAFEHTITAHVGQLQVEQGLEVLVTDSAGFTAACLQAYAANGVKWIMSVPSTLKRAKERVAAVDRSRMQPLTEGYWYLPVRERYAGIPQRWLVVYSEQARQRVAKTVTRELWKRSEEERQAFEQLGRQRFNCQEDAEAALASYQQSLRVLEVHEVSVTAHKHYAHAGRPSKDAVPDALSYHLSGVLAAPVNRRAHLLTRRACFILASNELDEAVLSDAEVLAAYKGQAKVERGFRFLKDPMFLASTLYLKRVERIMALLMVMTVCLLVYAALEYRIRQTLHHHQQSVSDQKGQPTRRPTARWVFELFLDVHLVTITAGVVQTLIVNLDQELKRLLELLGSSYVALYS